MATARTRNSAPPKSNAGIIATIVVLASIAASVLGLPGFAILWLGLAGAGFATVAPQLTGKNLKGQPEPNGEQEEMELRKFRFWSDYRWRSFVPGTDWLPFAEGKTWKEKLRLSAIWVVAVGLAAVAFTLPVEVQLLGSFPDFAHLAEDLAPYTDIFLLLNVLGAYIVPMQFTGSVRRTTDPQDAQSVVPFHSNIILTVIAPVVGLVAGFAALTAPAIVERVVDQPGYEFPIQPPLVFALGVFLAASGSIAYLANKAGTLADWEERREARATWKVALTHLKVDPRLTDHKLVGEQGVILDTFEAPGVPNADGMLALAPKLIPLLGAGRQAVMLHTPNLSGDGQPVPGTRHPQIFQVIQWPDGSMPDFTQLVDPEVAELALRSAAAWVHDEQKLPRADLVNVQRISTDESESHAYLATFLGEGAMYLDTTGAAIGRSLTGMDAFAEQGQGGILLYLGDLDNAELEDDSVRERMQRTAQTSRWNQRWKDALKQGVQVPVIQLEVHRSARLADGTMLEYQPFVFNQGVGGPKTYFGHEANLSTTLAAAPFVAILGFPASGGRPGERHPQALAVAWSQKNVPSSPSKLDPAGDRDAVKWVISGMVGRAFEAARLARPEVAAVTALTTQGTPQQRSKPHIWKIDLRLYDGVTITDVKKNAAKLGLSLNVEWLRITEFTDGCTIVAGVNPTTRGVEFARPSARSEIRSYLDYCLSLDWEQAFIDAKVIGSNGASTPKLVKSATLPKNDDVQVLTFSLPPGISRPQVAEAREKLSAATNNSFFIVRPGGSASEVELLVARENPLKTSIPVNWDEVRSSSVVPFGSTVEGEVAAYDWKESPHLLILGGSGSGKSATLQVLLTSALFRNAEVYVADPSKGAADFRFAEDYLKAVIVDTVETSAMMNALYAEVVRRKNLNSAHGVGSYRDLPAEIQPPHIVVVIDEFTSLMMADRLKKPSTNDPEVLAEYEEQVQINDAKANIGSKAGRIAREARSAGVTLILATQKLTSDTLSSIPGAGDLKTNMSRLLLGKTTFGDLQAGLRSPTEAPDLGSQVNAGRGIYETSIAAATIIQGWYEPGTPGSLLSQLVEAGVPTQPNKLDVTPFMPKTDTQGTPFSVIGGDAPAVMQPVEAPVAVVEEMEIDLSDADIEDIGEVDLSDLDFSEMEADDDVDADELVIEPVGGYDAATTDDEDDADWEAIIAQMNSRVEAEEQASAPAAEPVIEWPAEIHATPPVEQNYARTIGEDLFFEGEPRSREYEWDELDRLRDWLAVYEAPKRMVWMDPTLTQRDFFGISNAEHARALMEAAGIEDIVLPDVMSASDEEAADEESFIAPVVEHSGEALVYQPGTVTLPEGETDPFDLAMAETEKPAAPARPAAPAPLRELTPSELAAERAAARRAKKEADKKAAADDAFAPKTRRETPTFDDLF
jgi:hypothetical protein